MLMHSDNAVYILIGQVSLRHTYFFSNSMQH